MPGTSARSKASSPRPGMTVLELVDGPQNYSLWVWAPDASATLTCQTSRRHCERSEAIHREAKQKAGLLRCARNDDINRHTPTATHTSPFSRRGCARVVQEFPLS